MRETLLSAADKIGQLADSMSPQHKAPCCPRCGSREYQVTTRNVNRAGLLVGGLMFGLSNKTIAICMDCGKHFKI